MYNRSGVRSERNVVVLVLNEIYCPGGGHLLEQNRRQSARKKDENG